MSEILAHSDIVAGLVLYATGRQANTAGLGMETTNVVMRDNGSIQVNRYFATAEPSIYALGDVIDRVQLTPVAIQEAMVLVDHLFGDSNATIDYRDIPTAVFCQPEFGTVGLSEEQAREEYKDIAIYLSDFNPIFYRFRPDGDNPEQCLHEVLYMVPLPEGAERPAPASCTFLDLDDDYTEAPDFSGFLLKVFNQDAVNHPMVQKGIKNHPKGEIILASYQESKLRHFYQTLDK